MQKIKLWLVVLAALLLVGCSQSQNTEFEEYSQLGQLEGKRVGVLGGSVFYALIEKSVEDSSLQIYGSYADLCLALQNHKIDVIVTDQPIAQILAEETGYFAFWGDTGLNYEYALAFPRTPEGLKLKLELDNFLQKIQADGTWKKLQTAYLGSQAQKLPELDNSGDKTLKLAVNAVLRPFAYFFDGQITGYEVALATSFCRASGYQLQVENMDFAGTISAVATGKCDFCTPCIGITDLKKEQVYFSQPIYEGEAAVVYLKPEAQVSRGYWQGLKNDLFNNFVVENRWKLILHGLGVTLLIALSAGLGGTALGCLWVWLRRSSSPILLWLVKILLQILKGMPILILLMILYYIIFRSSGLSGLVIAVIGFSINFSVYVADILHTSIKSVESGQLEAALALGYNRVQAFKRVVLPQAMKFCLPLYKTCLISMVKSTSIVGYLAIMDLSKVTDLIRNMTYEPFFPLLLTTIIYFILTWLLFKLLVWMENKISLRRRERILKGIKIDA